MDEGMVLVYPELILHGKIPYRDFETFYGPANPYLLAGAYYFGGTNIFTERAMGLLYRLMAVLAVFGIARRWGVEPGAGCMFIAGALFICTQLIASAWIGAMACALSGIWMLSSNAVRIRCLFAGLLGGGAILFRPDIAPAVVLSAVTLLWRATWRERAQFLMGTGVAALPYLAMAWQAGLTNLWNNLFFYPVIVSNPGRRLPLSSAEPYVFSLLILHVVSCAIIGIAGIGRLRREKGSLTGVLLLSVAILALVLTPQTMQRLDLGHLLFAAIVSLPLLPVALVELATKFAAASRFVGLAAVMACVVAIQALAPEISMQVRAAYVAGLTARNSTAIFVEEGTRSFPLTSPAAARATAALFEKLEQLSRPGERLFVGPGDLRRTNYCDTFIYHLFPQLTPGTYFLEMNPLSANRPGSRLAADVASADWLILNRTWDNWHEPNRSVENGEDTASRVVQSAFAPVKEFGPYILLQRKSRDQRQ